MEHLRIATLNIWNRNGPWEERQALIRRGVEGLRPDVLALQEVLQLETEGGTMDQAEQILDGLGWHTVYGKGHDLTEELHFGNALASPHPISHHEVHALPGADESDQRRSVLYGVVETPGFPVHVFVTHLNWKRHEGRIRVAQVRFLASLIERTVPSSRDAYPPILLGDFNAEPESDEIRFLKGLATLENTSTYFADAWDHAGQGPGHTFDPRNPYAAKLHTVPRRVDYVFVRDPRRERGRPLSARLLFDEPSEGTWASDHFGVTADLGV